MTVSSTTNKVSYSGNGSNDTFAYTFKIFADADLKVFIRDSSGTETLKTITTHYTVTNAGVSTGGNVVFTSGNIPSATDTVVIQRELTLTQGTDYVENDPFPAQSHEDALDRLTFVTQQIQEKVDRSIKASVTNTIAGAEFTLSATDRANKVFAFDGSGDLSVTQELGTFRGNWAASTSYAVRDLVKDTSTNNIFIVNTAHTSSGAQPLTSNANSAKYDLIVDAATATSAQTAAASSASSASTSASTATTKASEAATSATNAASSATAAAASETAAAASETASAASETASAASETAAAASQTAAAASASSASSSASTATTKASEASTSATTATTKATEAASSATTASTQASNAATSAATATTKASEASTSATNAASSATAAASSATAAASSQTAAAASAASAASAFDNFDDTYLGSKTSNPSTDNDGDALVAGALYFNSNANEMRVYDGANWIAATSAGNVSLILYEYNATANQTTFSGSDTNSATLSYTVDNLQVVVNGIVLDPSDFTATNGTSVVLASGAAAGDVVNIYAFKSFTTADMVSKSAGGTFAGAVNFGAGATVTGNLTADGLRLGDGDIAAFGDAQDLQILHNGNNSFITDAGTGDLYIRGNNNLFVQNLDGSENKAQFITDGAVNLMHDGTTRISTSSTGADVVGVVKANGHTSSAASVFEGSGNGDSVALQLKVKANDGSSSTQGLYGNAGSTSAGNTIVLGNSGSSGLLVNNSGFVGIPQSASTPSVPFEVKKENAGFQAILDNDNGSAKGLKVRVKANDSGDFPVFQAVSASTGSDVEVFTINDDGNTTIGTTEFSLFNQEGTNARLTVAGSDTSTDTIGNGGAAINIVQTNGTAGNSAGLHFSRQDTDGHPNYSGAAIIAQFTDTQATGQYPKARLVFNTSTSANAAPSEKMRLETNGCLRLGTTSDEGFNNGLGTLIMKCSGGDALNINHTVNGNHVVNIKQSGPNTANFFFFFKNGNQVGRIQCSTSATSYDSLSDVRTKENIEDMTGAIGRVKQLKPKRFNFIVNPDETVDGFLAHEVTSICPHAVSGTPDDVDDNGDPVYQTMDVAKLVPLLTGALQEALAKIETLETKVAALEAGS